ncbi:tripartite tricarboxylate transporter substrate binding protein [Pigmentiphaga daeguensis]|uniref:Tripartite tricarboxylate transporter substrate binding protein n=1 Tax=Pigmentiphaga daeguensis TaxID=414049 RepID=A0ABN1CAA5_9BURK
MRSKPIFPRAMALALAACAAGAQAQAWPARPIRLIVPGAPGAPADTAARSLADAVAERLGQPVVVENRAGAQGTLGLGALIKAAPDGYTLGMITMQLSAIPALRKQAPFDLGRDLAPVVQMTTESPVFVVRRDLPMRNMKEFVAYAKARPGEITYGTPGPGSPAHLGVELMSRSFGLQLRHVPYKTISVALTDVAGGQIDAALAGSAAALTGLATGRIKALAVASPVRLKALPDVPTLAEAGLPDVDIRGWVGLVAPAGTPPAIVDQLNAAFNQALARPEVKERLASVGAEAAGGTPAEFGAFIAAEAARWRGVIESAHISAD